MLTLLRKEGGLHAIDRQVNFWVRLGKGCIDNPELPTTFVAEYLASPGEVKGKGFIPLPLERLINRIKNTKNPIAL